jgi:hypothetical protein
VPGFSAFQIVTGLSHEDHDTGGAAAVGAKPALQLQFKIFSEIPAA